LKTFKPAFSCIQIPDINGSFKECKEVCLFYLKEEDADLALKWNEQEIKGLTRNGDKLIIERYNGTVDQLFESWKRKR